MKHKPKEFEVTRKKKLVKYFEDTKKMGISSIDTFGMKGGYDFKRMMTGLISVEDYVCWTYFNVKPL